MSSEFIARKKKGTTAKSNTATIPCETFLIVIAWLAIFVAEVPAEPVEIPLQKTESGAYASHILLLDGAGGTGSFSDASGPEDEDPEFAFAATLPPDIGGTADDPHAMAYGHAYQTSIAGNHASPNNDTSVLMSMDIYAENEPGAWATVGFHTYWAYAYAHWMVDAEVTETPWIESAIAIVGSSGGYSSSGGLIATSANCGGNVVVADSRIQYSYDDDQGGLQIWGTLMGLDGPHEINTFTSAPGMVLIARQYVVPGVEFATGSDQMDGQAHVTASQDELDHVIGGGLFGEVSASVTVRAYIGTPSASPVHVPGDYNEDGVVDAADYTVWRDNIGAPSLPNDAGLGTVREAHYWLWKSHFGATSGSGSGNALVAVPEPATWWLAVVGCLTVALGARRA
jgi:hypothetical protein